MTEGIQPRPTLADYSTYDDEQPPRGLHFAQLFAAHAIYGKGRKDHRHVTYIGGMMRRDAEGVKRWHCAYGTLTPEAAAAAAPYMVDGSTPSAVELVVFKGAEYPPSWPEDQLKAMATPKCMIGGRVLGYVDRRTIPAELVGMIDYGRLAEEPTE
jgi:hypothetical protein